MNDISINITDRSGNKHTLLAPIDIQMSLMEFLRMYDFGVEGVCGGIAECATCHIYVNSNHNLRELQDIEDIMLDEVYSSRRSNSRLGCQIYLNRDLDGLDIEIAPEQV